MSKKQVRDRAIFYRKYCGEAVRDYLCGRPRSETGQYLIENTVVKQ